MRPAVYLLFLLSFLIPACSVPYPIQIVWSDGPDINALRELKQPLTKRYADTAFSRPITPLQPRQVKLEYALSSLSREANVPFRIEWRELKDVGIERDYPITPPTDPDPVRTLKSILEEASAGNELDPLDYALIEGVIHISTAHHLLRTGFITAHYPVYDILAENHRGIVNHRVLREWSPHPERPPAGKPPANVEDQLLQLIDLLQSTYPPQHPYKLLGGDVSNISELHGRLIIRAPIDYHMQIWRLLIALRQSRP